MSLKLSNTGDTIVEVMVVLAVLGLAISISYATANRSLLNARQAQENSQATELLQSQIEALRSLAPNGTADPAKNVFQSAGTKFCIDTSGANYTVAKPADTNPANPTSPACQSGLYRIAVTYDSAANDTFTAKASWPDVLGEGQDSVTLIYRTHLHE
jgi:type II secretory pathway pseudopilin PulG